MTKIVRALGAAMLCLGLLSSANIMAKQDPAAPAQEKKDKQPKADTATINGTVAAVTDSAVTVVDAQKTELTVTVNSETKVTKAGKDATLADVKANDVVAIEVKKGDGETWTAVRIAVT